MPDVIHIARDFSRFPAGRFLTDGPASGTLFRDRFLEPSLKEDGRATVILDDVQGLPPSFLEEAFGGLVRLGYAPEFLQSKFSLVANTERMKRYPDLIWHYVDRARRSVNGS